MSQTQIQFVEYILFYVFMYSVLLPMPPHTFCNCSLSCFCSFSQTSAHCCRSRQSVCCRSVVVCHATTGRVCGLVQPTTSGGCLCFTCGYRNLQHQVGACASLVVIETVKVLLFAALIVCLFHFNFN